MRPEFAQQLHSVYNPWPEWPAGGVATSVNSSLTGGAVKTAQWAGDLATKGLAALGKTPKAAGLVEPVTHGPGVLDAPKSIADQFAEETIRDTSFFNVAKAMLAAQGSPIAMLTSEYQTDKIKNLQKAFLSDNASALSNLSKHRQDLLKDLWDLNDALGGESPGRKGENKLPGIGRAMEIIAKKKQLRDEAATSRASADNWVPGETPEALANQKLYKDKLDKFLPDSQKKLDTDTSEANDLESRLQKLNDMLYGAKVNLSGTVSDLAYKLNGAKLGPERPESAAFVAAMRNVLLGTKPTFDFALLR
jgi:hypothetical protein